MIKCIIIEDQPPAQRVLQKYIKDAGTLELSGTFSDALSGLEFLRANHVDLIFLDIHLPKLSGIDLINILSPKPKIILTTAFSDYALKGYELDITDYLLKPFSFERFIKAISKVIIDPKQSIPQTSNTLQTSTNSFTFVKSGHDYLRILHRDILFIKAEGDYTLVQTVEKRHMVLKSLRNWTLVLPDDLFSQVHKSYVIQVPAISKVSGNIIFINDFEIPIGRTFKDVFFNQYLEK